MQTVYVGVNGAPTSQGRFIALPTCEALDPDALTRDPVEYLEPTPPCTAAPGLAEARQLVIAARIAFEYQSNAATAADLLACATSHYRDPALDLSEALMEIRAGRFSGARISVERAIDQDWDPHTAAIARYLRGRLAADEGSADAARADFQAVQVNGLGDERLIAAARTAERKLGHRRRLRLQPIEVVPMGWLPDAFRYLGRM